MSKIEENDKSKSNSESPDQEHDEVNVSEQKMDCPKKIKKWEHHPDQLPRSSFFS